MKSKNKSSRKSISFNEAEKLLTEALKAEPKDLKVPISLRLDGDIYLALKKHAENGYGQGKYQAYLNQILRNHLFNEKISVPKSGKKAG